ncbi:MAG: peptidase S9, partial [Gemmatimonadetes bacterium]|nr:peptidase S9 [Gemmatimonadota bacterium]
MSLRNKRSLWGPALLAGVMVLACAPSASAQYFGRNKVQYETFDWQVMSTPHYRIHFYPAEREHTVDAARQAERWNARLSRTFQHRLSEVKPIILYANHPDFQQTNVISGLIEVGTGGVTEPLRTRLIMPFTGVYADDDHVLGHEMVHVFQFDIASSGVGGGLGSMNRLPLWMI